MKSFFATVYSHELLSSYRPALVMLVCSLVLLPLLMACADNLPPTDVGRHYLDAVNAANFSAAYDLLSADSQLKVSRSQFVDRLTRARQEAGISKAELIRVQEPSVAGHRASLAYQLEVTVQNGQKLSLFESMLLLQQDAGWRVIWPPQ